ncbi:MAG: sensor histidine kinase [Candidatus Hodarchaeales archaeon]
MVINDEKQVHHNTYGNKEAFFPFKRLLQPVCIIEPDSLEIVFVNTTFSNIFSKSTELLGNSFLSLFSKEDQGEINQALANIDEESVLEIKKEPILDVSNEIFSSKNSSFRLFEISLPQQTYVICEFLTTYPEVFENLAMMMNDPLISPKPGYNSREYRTQLYSVVHELNNVFSVLISNRELLEIYLHRIKDLISINSKIASTRVDKPLNDSLEILDDNRLILSKLVEVLENAQRFLQREFYKLEVLDIKGVITNTIEYLKRTFNFPTEVTVTIDDDMGIYGNHTHFTILFKNILLNAFQACDGLEISRVRILGYHSNGNNIISINDTGCGIPRDALPIIYDPYYSNKEKAGNLGLGLTICRDIVKFYNGSINIQSVEGQGTTVKIKLPVY